MAGELGDGASVRRLGQALQAAGRGLSSVIADLSGQMKSLVPAGWSGPGADTAFSDWDGKAGKAGQLAAVILTTSGMGAAVFLGDPRSLVGMSRAALQKLVEGWSGPSTRPLGASEQRAVRSLQRQIAEHEQKLADYQRDPYA